MANIDHNYSRCRDWCNIQRAFYEGVGEYGVPEMRPIYLDPETVPPFIGFNYAKTCAEPEQHGVHFFIDDYQFVRVWNDPDRYLQMLKRFKYVVATDFSNYDDFPKAVRVFQHYRDMWLARYWQDHGIQVIPCPGWSGWDVPNRDFDWIFDGMPEDSAVCISSVGYMSTEYSREGFNVGFNEMVRRLHPVQIVFNGMIPEGLDFGGAMIFHQESFHEQMRRRTEGRTRLDTGRGVDEVPRSVNDTAGGYRNISAIRAVGGTSEHSEPEK